MDLSVSIVNWNVCGYLEKCLESVYRHRGGMALEVFVVDNASKDGSVEMVRRRFPQAVLIENRENAGFGRAHNQVLPLAKGRHVLFLNPDTEMLPSTLPSMLEFMDMHPEAGAAMCDEVDSVEGGKTAIDLDVRLGKAGRFLWEMARRVQKTFPNALTEKYLLDTALKDVQLQRGRVFTSVSSMESGFLWVRRKVLEEVGGFDPKFFLGGEGVELTQRIKKKGWKLYYVPSIDVVHYGSRSSQQWDQDELNKAIGEEAV